MGESGTLGELLELCARTESAVGALLDRTGIDYRDINAGNSGIVVLGRNPHHWQDLDGPGQHALGIARGLADTWTAHIELAIRVGAPERLTDFQGHQASLDQVLRRNQKSTWTHGAPGSSIEEVRTKVARQMNQVRELLRNLPTANGPGGRVYVPDTNALIWNPDIEDWSLPGHPCALVFVPQVIRELDSKKQDSRIGKKADSVIRRLKEYDRRGDTFAGVPLAGDVSVREVAVDAPVRDSLCWLDPGHADDQLLASVLALKLTDLRAHMTVVTRDRNLQNKARLARVEYLDVEDLAPEKAAAA